MGQVGAAYLKVRTYTRLGCTCIPLSRATHGGGAPPCFSTHSREVRGAGDGVLNRSSTHAHSRMCCCSCHARRFVAPSVSALTGLVVNAVGELEARDVATTLWACASIGHYDRRMFDLLCAKVGVCSRVRPRVRLGTRGGGGGALLVACPGQ